MRRSTIVVLGLTTVLTLAFPSLFSAVAASVTTPAKMKGPVCPNGICIDPVSKTPYIKPP